MFQQPVRSLVALALIATGAGAIGVSPEQAAAATPTISAAPSDSATPTTTVSPPATPSAAPNRATRARLAVPAKVIIPGAKPKIPWPKTGRARLQVAGIGALGHSGNGKSVPIASVTKVMTAYVILRNHPLARGQNGPKIRVTRAEAASYSRRKAAGESLVKVAPGKTFTERQALQGLLLASGNNMADILGRWDAGSVRSFVRKMNENANRLGMTSTHFADTSGLSAGSRSSSADLLKLAPAAMSQGAFATIVRQTRANIPLNKMKNTNKLLGRHGVIGIKTGSTRAAGGCLLFAAQRTVSGRVYTIYGTVLGAPGPKILTNALASSDKLIVAARKTLKTARLVPAGRTVATVTNADGTITNLTVAKSVTAVGWGGLTYTLSLPAGLRPGQIPKTLTARTSARTLIVPLIKR